MAAGAVKLPAFISRKYRVTATSLDLPDNLLFEDWCALGAELGRARNMIAWWIGDWWIKGDHRYGTRKQMIADWGGPSFQTCENYGAICRRLAPSRRREGLSFSHHREVAFLPPAEADELLDWCLKEGDPRRVWQLKNEIRRRVKSPEPVTIEITIADVSPAPRVVAFTPRLVTGLDTSPAGGSTPSALAALEEEPIMPRGEEPVIPRVEIAKQAIAALDCDEALAVFAAWFHALPTHQQAEVKAALFRS
jgi:hypothetical protein